MSSRVLEELAVGAADFGSMGGGPNEISSPSTSITSSKSRLSRLRAGPRGPVRLRLGSPFDISTPMESPPGAGRRVEE
jgi:hypothetical protein